MGENTLTCSHKDCPEPIYEKGKCIFHCGKDDWFEVDDKDEQDWSKSKEKVEFFWEELEKRFVNQNFYIFTYFIFPVFLDNSFFARDERSEIKSYCDFGRSIFLDEAIFLNCHFLNETFFSLVQFRKGLKFESCSFKKLESSFSFFCKKIDFQSIEFFDNTSFSMMFFSEEPIDIIMLGITIHKNFIFSIQNIYQHNNIREDARNFKNYKYSDKPRIKELTMSQLVIMDKANAQFWLPSATVDKFWIVGVTNNGNLRIYDLKIVSDLFITMADMGKAFLLNVDCLNCETIKINRSFLSEITFNSVNWGDKRRIEYNRDTFRQLKHAYDRQVNYIEANEFYALEMKAYEKDLKEKYSCYAERIFSVDWLVFRLGWFASNHSQYWILPLAWMLVSSIGFYESAVYAAGLEQGWNCYFSFANPFSTKYDGDGLGWWILNKAFFAFFAYHFIVSLRRNTKR